MIHFGCAINNQQYFKLANPKLIYYQISLIEDESKLTLTGSSNRNFLMMIVLDANLEFTGDENPSFAPHRIFLKCT